jgi:hypothetical protein
MTTVTFTYKKNLEDKGSERVLIPIHFPSTKYFGIDITQLDVEDQVNIEKKVVELQGRYLESLNTIMKEFDCSNSFRTFFEDKMSSIIKEE